jgi:nicotinamidase-related amidase
MLEARSKRYDTIMLRDCCGTINRKHAQENVAGHFEQFGGSMLTGKELEEALQHGA